MRLLIVDDDQTVLEQLAESLGEDGRQITTAGSAKEALELLAATSPRPQIMLTDIRMEQATSGLELVGKVRARYPETLIIVMTGYGTIDIAVRVMKEGAYDFLTKPFRLASIEDKLKQASRELAYRTELQIKTGSKEDNSLNYDPLEWLANRALELPILLVTPRSSTSLASFPGLEPAKHIWLTTEKAPNGVPPGHLHSLKEMIEAFTGQQDRGLVYMEGIGQLVELHGWESTFNFLRQLFQMIKADSCYSFFGVAPKELKEEQRDSLQKLLTDDMIMAVGQAIAHQVRLSILQSLMMVGHTTFNRILRKIDGISSSVLTHHLKQLVQTGLVTKSEEAIYSLSDEGKTAVRLLEQFRDVEKGAINKPSGLLAIPSLDVYPQG